VPLSGRVLLLALALLAASPAAAATRCEFAYDDGVRRELVEPALVLFGQAKAAERLLATYYNLQKPGIEPTGRDDGTLILTFIEDALDGGILSVVIDPCARRVLYVEERSFVSSLLGDDNIKTDDPTLKSALIGSWIVPPGSWLIRVGEPAAQPDINLRIVQSFRADGSGLTEVYKDGACTIPDRSVAFSWSVNGGVLTVHPAKVDPDAFLMLSEMLGIALDQKPDRLLVYAPDHKHFGLLNRAPRCGWPDNLELRRLY